MKSLDPASLPTIWLASYASGKFLIYRRLLYTYIYVSIEGRIETVAKFLYFVETVNQIRSKNFPLCVLVFASSFIQFFII